MRFPRWLDFRRPRTRSLGALALLFTLLNAPKPLLIDDGAYYCYARQICRDPLRPYDFVMFWDQQPEPANSVLAPPVLPYWLAIALVLFGENSFLWKLWLFPFCFLFVGALDALLRRFAKGVVGPVLWMTVLSPTFLPSLNLMLDVPALALGLMAATVFFRARTRGSFPRAALAGLLAGLAMETKYTGFLAPAVIVLYAALFRRKAGVARRGAWLAPVAVLLAVGLFVAWESLIALSQGESHFLCNLRQNDDSLRSKANLALPLMLILGALGPPVVLLSWTAIGVSRLVVTSAGAVVALGFGLMAVLPVPLHAKVTPGDVVLGAFGIVTLATAAVVIGFLLFGRRPRQMAMFAAMDWFLVLWLGGEVLGCFALTPFSAARRVMGVVIVGTLLAARLATRTCRGASRQRLLRGVAAAGVGFGLLFYALDLHGAFAEKQAVERAAALIRRHAPDATVWYVGHWGFQFYAERAGMKPVIPEQSLLQEGDWLVMPDRTIMQQQILVDSNCMTPLVRFHVDDAVPLRTVPGFYGGHSPLQRATRPRFEVAIYRVIRPVVPVSDPDPE